MKTIIAVLLGLFVCDGGDLYFSFSELGYDCVAPNENMRQLAVEYADEH